MRRGEIWFAELDQPIGTRPVLLLTRNSVIDGRTSLTVAPITRTIRDIRSHVLLEEKDGLRVKCAVNLDDIATIPRSLLTNRITMLSAEKMQEVNDAIIFALDLRV